jgi:hypothetical protein
VQDIDPPLEIASDLAWLVDTPALKLEDARHRWVRAAGARGAKDVGHQRAHINVHIWWSWLVWVKGEVKLHDMNG